MNEHVANALSRLKETVQDIEDLDNSYWNVSLGISHLNAYAEQVVNDAKTLAAHLKSYGNAHRQRHKRGQGEHGSLGL